MQIDRIELYHVRMPLIYPFRTAFGEDAVIESVLAKMSCGDLFGWGESSPFASPSYSGEWAGGVFHTINHWLAPRLIGRDVSSGEQLQQLLSTYKGNQFAKAALDLAWWDLHARQIGRPLYEVLGGRRREVIVGADFGVMESIGQLVRTIEEAVADGFQRVKLKFRRGWDFSMVEAVRKEFPEVVLHVDCNSSYRLRDAALFKSLDQFNLAMIEQPLGHDDLVDHAALQGQLQTPICLDESITSPDNARKAIALDACRYINIKPGRVGGLTNAITIHDLALAAGIPCWVGGMLESAVGASHCVALATLPGFTYPADIFPTNRFYESDLARPETTLSKCSTIEAHDTPGIGAEPDQRRLSDLTLDYRCVKIS